jgi:hypothetical protein
LARTGSDAAVDSDLISGMLTAVRDFMHDSFSQQEGHAPVDEIQYGEQRIIIQDGRLCYLAVVIHGIEPPGFRAELRRFITRLQTDQYPALSTFSGDMAELGEIPPAVERLAVELGRMAPPSDAPKPLTGGQKWLLALGGLGGLAALLLACFYLQFTWALLPLAFGDPSPTPTITASPSPTATATPTPTPTTTATPSPTPSPTATDTPTATPPPTFTATATHIPFSVSANRPVWAYSQPNLAAERVEIIDGDTALTVVEVDGPWLLVEWQTPFGLRQGWVTIRWVEVAGTPPSGFPATPAP